MRRLSLHGCVHAVAYGAVAAWRMAGPSWLTLAALLKQRQRRDTCACGELPPQLGPFQSTLLHILRSPFTQRSQCTRPSLPALPGHPHQAAPAQAYTGERHAAAAEAQGRRHGGHRLRVTGCQSCNRCCNQTGPAGRHTSGYTELQPQGAGAPAAASCGAAAHPQPTAILSCDLHSFMLISAHSLLCSYSTE